MQIVWLLWAMPDDEPGSTLVAVYATKASAQRALEQCKAEDKAQSYAISDRILRP